MAKYYNPERGGGGANAGATIQIGGAVAFSYTDHNVRTWITNTADLNSNDDMELTSAHRRGAEPHAPSTATEAQQGKQNAKTGLRAPNTSADNAISLAISIGVMNNTSRAIIGCSTDPSDEFYCATQNERPDLDSMRALRLLSGVTLPVPDAARRVLPVVVQRVRRPHRDRGHRLHQHFMDGTLGL